MDLAKKKKKKLGKTYPPKMAFSIDELSHVIPFGKTKIYELINKGALKAEFIHGRRIVLLSAVEQLLNGHVQLESSNQ